MSALYTYPTALIVGVHDGDTVKTNVDLGMDIWRYVTARVVLSSRLGINAIELGNPGGRETRDHVLQLAPVGSTVELTSYRWDKYGNRLDCRIVLPDGRNLAQVLIDEGYAVAWNGQGQRPVPDWPITQGVK